MPVGGRHGTMRICLIGPTHPFRGGISHYTTLLCRALARRHAVRFIAFRRQYPGWLFPGTTDRDPSSAALRAPGAERLIDGMNPLTWVAAALRAAEFRPALVVLPWWVGFWGAAFWTIGILLRMLTRARIVFLCHNVVAHEAGRFDRWATRLALSVGHAFIVHSAEDARNLRELRPLARIARSPHPTYEVFSTGRLSRGEARRLLGLADDERVVLFFGFVRPYKGLPVLLEALARVLREMPVSLLVVGEFYEDRALTERRIEKLGLDGRVTLVDRYVPNEEVERYFAAADVVALPYLSATGSGICQIAFGHGRAVIATAVGCLPEVVADGRTGLVVPPGDAAALAAALVRFFREGLRDRFEREVLRRRRRFEWGRMVETIEGLAPHPEDAR